MTARQLRGLPGRWYPASSKPVDDRFGEIVRTHADVTAFALSNEVIEAAANNPYLAAAVASLQRRTRAASRQLADSMDPTNPRADQTIMAAVMRISPTDFKRLVAVKRRMRALQSRQKVTPARRAQPAVVSTAGTRLRSPGDIERLVTARRLTAVRKRMDLLRTPQTSMVASAAAVPNPIEQFGRVYVEPPSPSSTLNQVNPEWAAYRAKRRERSARRGRQLGSGLG